LIQVELLNNLGDRDWDLYVRAHPQSSPYHLIGWKKAVELAYQHPCFSFVAKEGNLIKGVLPLVKIKVPLAGSNFCSLPYCDIGGVLSDSEKVSEKLIEAAKKLAASEGASSLSLRQSAPNSKHNSDGEGTELEPGTKVRMILKLPGSAELLLNGFKAKLRSQIKKAEKNGVQYRIAEGLRDRDAFYKVMQINMRQLGSPVHSRTWFDSVLDFYKEDARLFIVHVGEVVVGGSIVLTCGETATVPWASTLPDYNRLAPNMLLYWGMLEFAADKGFKRFDFGRSTIGEGTFNFKKQWGAVPVALDWQEHLQQKPPSRETDNSLRLRSRVAATWSKLPLPLVNFLGPKFRRYISL
jgi:FemAB-related protein (PEP-CTERM system-associated)